VAVIVLPPTGSVLVVTVATPFVTVPVPITVDPSENVTVPVAVVGSVAVKVTGCVAVEGFDDEVSTTVGESLLTVCVACPVAGRLFESPL
jgi:hypothetical protein